jgi:hypothetical protein
MSTNYNKLTEEQVLSIRNSSKTTSTLAKIYSVSISTVKRIRSRQIWKDLKPKNVIHGDVNLIGCNILPKTAKLINDTIKKTNLTPHGVWLELGEHTGNYHAIAPTIGGVVNFYKDGDTIYTEVKEAPATIFHQEPAPLVINPGIYKKLIEWEYDPFKKAIQRVID